MRVLVNHHHAQQEGTWRLTAASLHRRVFRSEILTVHRLPLSFRSFELVRTIYTSLYPNLTEVSCESGSNTGPTAAGS
jgi:hypothetical protein